MSDLKYSFVKPEDLPDLQTVKEILLEVEDLHLFNIGYNPAYSDSPLELLKYNLGRKKFYYYDNVFINGSPEIEEKKFLINRYIMTIGVCYKSFRQSKTQINVKDIYELSEVIERLKSYLGKDFIGVETINSGIRISLVLNNITKLSSHLSPKLGW